MKKVVITGPESTGKSTLTKQLAKYFQAPLVPEYARSYLQKLGRDYQQDDLLKIARGQLDLEQNIDPSADWLFCDTDLRVIKIWSLVKYDAVDPWIDLQIAKHPCDLYLLCDIDLPWEADPQREHPQQRRYLLELYLRELQQVPYKLVQGQGSERLQNALEAIASLSIQN